ncbi:hypothetical protein K402DRAFT_395006 [Aulographum hederae CBS 113979]|uniref:DNA recombination and repair protein Rad51-like C-terminal domain-containing protein n=1 Tax=Aulographum hederae CBS 113979 TaxID=1176131 RepID=A0A6G1GWI1_9PEZI|nr:hypothetical protein K402DRAFT_395006 [Aulographum hederae CBS 113979]
MPPLQPSTITTVQLPPPTQPILASTLYQNLPTSAQSQNGRKRRRIGTGCAAVDGALDGGLDYGKGGGVTCLSGGLEEGRSLSLHFLVSHLLSSPNTTASIIDTTGSFLVGLQQVLLHRIRVEDSSSSRKRGQLNLDNGYHVEGQEASIEERATSILDKVEYTRVFDFVGLVEAVGEVREKLEASKRISGVTETKEVFDQPSAEMTKQPKVDIEAKKYPLEIPDSQGSEGNDEMLFDDADEMLFDGANERDSPTISRVEADKSVHGNQEQNTFAKQDTDDEGEARGMILVDNISQVIMPLIKSNHVQAHALFIPFLRSLTNLTTTHNVSTLLLNTVIPSTSRQTSSENNARFSPHLDKHPSIFANNTSIPALGRTFPHYVDLHLLLGSLPKDRRDMELFGRFGSVGGRTGGGRAGVKMVNVVEVLQDRYDGRMGRWAAFGVGGVRGEELIGVV